MCQSQPSKGCKKKKSHDLAPASPCVAACRLRIQTIWLMQSQRFSSRWKLKMSLKLGSVLQTMPKWSSNHGRCQGMACNVAGLCSKLKPKSGDKTGLGSSRPAVTPIPWSNRSKTTPFHAPIKKQPSMVQKQNHPNRLKRLQAERGKRNKKQKHRTRPTWISPAWISIGLHARAATGGLGTAALRAWPRGHWP